MPHIIVMRGDYVTYSDPEEKMAQKNNFVVTFMKVPAVKKMEQKTTMEK